MAAILVVCATTDGHTRTICERIETYIDSRCDRVTLISIEQASTVELSAFDKVVVGASIRYGRHSPLVRKFVDANASVLATKPSAFFSVNLVARKSDKNQPETNPYLRKFLQESRWRPREVEVFAGKLDYPRYGFIDRLVIRLIMLITDGPTDPRTVVEFTDWQRVKAFAHRIATM